MEQVCISRRQHNVHVLTEIAAVTFFAPFLAGVATMVPPPASVVLWGWVVATIVVDGGLAARNVALRPDIRRALTLRARKHTGQAARRAKAFRAALRAR